MLSFPAGIVRVIMDNPHPATLSFRVTNTSQIHHILLNKQLLTQLVWALVDIKLICLNNFIYNFISVELHFYNPGIFNEVR